MCWLLPILQCWRFMVRKTLPPRLPDRLLCHTLPRYHILPQRSGFEGFSFHLFFLLTFSYRLSMSGHLFIFPYCYLICAIFLIVLNSFHLSRYFSCILLLFLCRFYPSTPMFKSTFKYMYFFLSAFLWLLLVRIRWPHTPEHMIYYIVLDSIISFHI